jgi:hypothetical protein
MRIGLLIFGLFALMGCVSQPAAKPTATVPSSYATDVAYVATNKAAVGTIAAQMKLTPTP